MGDLTYDPNEQRRPRPIASPFGVVPTPGFNVVDPQAAQAITVIGKGESQLLVPTGDNVREPQNRRVEIVVQ